MSADIIQVVRMADRLQEIRRLMKSVYGERFDSLVAYWESIIRKIAADYKDGNVIAAALDLCKDPHQDERETMLIMAVAAEMLERERKARGVRVLPDWREVPS